MKWLLFPFTLLFAAATGIRNFLYDSGFIKSYHSKIKTICIGNLQVGGSGKTPMTALLFSWFAPDFKVSILSRGYGRKTSGLIEANRDASPHSIGDEPYWYHSQLRAHTVVAEKRKLGLQFLEQKNTNLVLLDDAFQHRNVRCDVNIVLTDCHKPFFKDTLMPMGRLRESANGLKRADVLIYTKCPLDLSEQQKLELIGKATQVKNVFFSGIVYDTPKVLKGEHAFQATQYNQLIAVSAIANSKPFVEHCKSLCSRVEVMDFKDHHDYQLKDIQEIVKKLNPQTLVLCTEKDAVKLKAEQFDSIIPHNQFYYVPIQTKILFEEEKQLKALIESKLSIG